MKQAILLLTNRTDAVVCDRYDKLEKEYDEEIKSLEIDEQNILQLIEDIKNFENKNI